MHKRNGQLRVLAWSPMSCLCTRAPGFSHSELWPCPSAADLPVPTTPRHAFLADCQRSQRRQFPENDSSSDSNARLVAFEDRGMKRFAVVGATPGSRGCE